MPRWRATSRSTPPSPPPTTSTAFASLCMRMQHAVTICYAVMPEQAALPLHEPSPPPTTRSAFASLCMRMQHAVTICYAVMPEQAALSLHAAVPAAHHPLRLCLALHAHAARRHCLLCVHARASGPTTARRRPRRPPPAPPLPRSACACSTPSPSATRSCQSKRPYHSTPPSPPPTTRSAFASLCMRMQHAVTVCYAFMPEQAALPLHAAVPAAHHPLRLCLALHAHAARRHHLLRGHARASGPITPRRRPRRPPPAPPLPRSACACSTPSLSAMRSCQSKRPYHCTPPSPPPTTRSAFASLCMRMQHAVTICYAVEPEQAALSLHAAVPAAHHPLRLCLALHAHAARRHHLLRVYANASGPITARRCPPPAAGSAAQLPGVLQAHAASCHAQAACSWPEAI